MSAVCHEVTDWVGTGTMLYGIGTILGALAIFGAAVIGSNTFNRWRQQKLAERRIEQAERILTATYKVRRGLSYVRGPAMWAHELETSEEQLKANGEWNNASGESERRKLATAQAYYNRLKQTRDAQKALARLIHRGSPGLVGGSGIKHWPIVGNWVSKPTCNEA